MPKDPAYVDHVLVDVRGAFSPELLPSDGSDVEQRGSVTAVTAVTADTGRADAVTADAAVTAGSTGGRGAGGAIGSV